MSGGDAEAIVCARCGATTPPGPACAACGADPKRRDEPLANEPLAAGTVVDKKYSIVRVLGSGGMGVVYLARDVHTGVDVVLKAIRGDLAHRADVRERVLEEGRSLARIDHPNVVHLNAVVVDGASLWLVMQYVDGESLEKTIARARSTPQRALPLAEIVRIFRQIALGVGAVHREGLIHRDLKPANVLLRAKDGAVKVTDFGIAKPQRATDDGTRIRTKGVVGSVHYMSPEQVTGRRDFDARVDIYALGILLFEMLTGRVPFDGPSNYDVMKAHVDEPVPSVSAARPDVPAALDGVIARACAKNRDERFRTCEELVQALDLALAAPATTQADPLSPLERASMAPATQPTRPLATTRDAEPLGRRWALWGVGALVLCGLGAAIVIATRDDGGGAPSAIPSASVTAPPTVAEPSASVTTEPERSGLAELVGSWTVNGRELIAVQVGSTVEFRVVTAEQFAPADYEAGEARFVLREAPDEAGTFLVEDRLRPLPPEGSSFDRARARGTCQGVYGKVGAEPLRARLEAQRLSVDLVKIEPKLANFVQSGGRVVSCVGLGKLEATRVVATLTRR